MPVDLRTHPDPGLLVPCLEVDRFDGALADRLEALLALARREGGIGLAAPQGGWLARLAWVDLAAGRRDPEWVALANPVLVGFSGEQVNEEGCLSVPGRRVAVRRPARVEVEAFDPRGRRRRYQARGLAAACMLHEMDHLEGRLMLSRNAWALALPAHRRLA